MTADQMPDDNAKLANIPVQLPEVPLSGIAAPESFVSDIREYLEIEDYEPDGKLQFLRTADVDGTLYYIWKFQSAGDDCYATVSISDGSDCIGCNENHWGLTPEQFIMADYHNCI